MINENEYQNLDQLCAISDGVYFQILEVLNIYDECVQATGAGDDSTENTIKGCELYYAIESAVASAMNFNYEFEAYA